MSTIAILQGCLVLLVLSAITFAVFAWRNDPMCRYINLERPLEQRLLPEYLFPFCSARHLTGKAVTFLGTMRYMVRTGQVFHEAHKRFNMSTIASFVRTSSARSRLPRSDYETFTNSSAFC